MALGQKVFLAFGSSAIPNKGLHVDTRKLVRWSWYTKVTAKYNFYAIIKNMARRHTIEVTRDTLMYYRTCTKGRSI